MSSGSHSHSQHHGSCHHSDPALAQPLGCQQECEVSEAYYQQATAQQQHKHDHCQHGHTNHQAERETAQPLGNPSFRPLAWVLGLSLIYFVAELLGGWLTGSIALLADAFHMISDALSLALALAAAWWGQRPITDPQRTFGNHRAEVLAGFLNGLGLVGVGGWIIWEALHRLQNQPEILAGPMFWVAVGGLVVNCIAIAILHRPAQGGNVNLRGAYLHVMGDLLGSVGAIAASLLIQWYGWLWADPVISIVIAILVIFSAVRLIRDTAVILLEWSPAHLSIQAIQSALLKQPGVVSVHDLHVWSIASHQWALSAHIIMDREEACRTETLAQLYKVLLNEFGIRHQTLQLETERYRKQNPTDSFNAL